MELVNYYKLLKVEPSADLNAIKKAFRTEIALYHPDKNSSEGARAHFDLLVEAFDILSDTNKRKTYDNILAKSLNSSIVVSTKEEEEEEKEYEEFEYWQYGEWKKDAKEKSDSYWSKELKDILLLDVFLEAGFSIGIDTLFDGLGDSLDGIGDIFDAF